MQIPFFEGESKMYCREILISAAMAVMVSGTALTPAMAQAGGTTPMATNPYAPFEFLIGDWDSNAGPSTIHQRLRYGPNKSYIFYSTFTAAEGEPERLHFEGIMVWNGKANALDYVFAVEPGSGAQEKGSVHVEADGSVVRDVKFTDSKGQVAHFRQTFRATGADSTVTSLMRQTSNGWEPNFPGSDKITMKRRRD
jgi:hypothetical protein